MADDRGKDGRNDAGGRADYRPEGTDAKTSLSATLKRTLTEFSEDNMTIWAAALTYFGLLSLFPALIAMVSIVGLVADPASPTRTLTDVVSSLGPARPRTRSRARSSRSRPTGGPPASCRSSASPARCGRPPATSAPSRRRPT